MIAKAKSGSKSGSKSKSKAKSKAKSKTGSKANPAAKTRRRKQAKEFERVKCGPVQENYFTCYDNATLHKLRDGWNARHPDARIDTNDPKEIWTAMKERMKGMCRNEACWLKQITGVSFANNDATFAPEAPKSWIRDPDEWLSSEEIENVMKQYEDKFPAFEFLGPSPSDYSAPKLAGVCVWEELCNFSLKKYADSDTRQIGVIFNTDPHTEDGAHWVSVFINLAPNNNYVFFFDSTGDRPQKEIREFIKTVTQQGRELGIRFKYHENRKQHQKRSTECGMYSLFMIVNLIEGTRTPEEFMRGGRIPDSHMLEFRAEYFNRGGSI
jgi:hypothetical protein